MTKVAVIGIGNMGSQHARVFSSIRGSSLVGVSDIKINKGKDLARKYKTTFYKNYLELLEKEKPTCISIAVPTIHHEEITINSMKYVNKIFLEKPLSHNLKSAKNILQNSKKYKCNLVLGYVERFNPVTTKLIDEINSDKIGNILSVSIKRVGPFPNNLNTNVVFDLTSHDIDLLKYMFNTSPKYVGSYGGSINKNECDYLISIFKVKNFYCNLESNWISPVKIRTIHVTGSKGYLEGELIKQQLTYYRSKILKDYENYNKLTQHYSNIIKKKYIIDKREPLDSELREFIHPKKSSNKLADADSSYNVLELSEKVINRLNK